MKAIYFFICSIFFSTLAIGQNTTIVKFKDLNQQFSFNKKTITVELKVEDADTYNKNSDVPMTLVLYCDNVKDKALISASNLPEISIIILPGDDSVEIEIPIIEDTYEKYKYLTFKLKKKGVNNNFSLLDSGHTVVLLSKNFDKGLISINKPKTLKKLELNLDELEKITVPFNIKVKGLSVVEKDKAMATINLNGKNSKEFNFYGQTFKSEFVIKREKNKGYFDSLVKTIKEKDFFTIKLTKLHSITNKNIVVDKKSDSIIIEVKDKRKPKARYDVFLGANFDLQDNLQATSFYSEVITFLPDVFKWGTKSVNIMAGIYKNSNSSNLEDSRYNQELLQITNTTSDSLTYSKKLVRTVPNVNIENLGLYASIFKDMDVSENKRFRSYIGLYFELIERSETYNYNSTDLIDLGATTIALSDLQNDRTLLNNLSRPTSFSRKYYDSYYGLSIPMYYNAINNDFEVFINPILGYGDPGLNLKDQDSVKPFVACQFHLIVSESSLLGIKLSGGVRKYFDFEQNPLININLSTRINLSGALKEKK